MVDNRLPAPSRNDSIDYNFQRCCGVSRHFCAGTLVYPPCPQKPEVALGGLSETGIDFGVAIELGQE
jgi:hypothetical protein